MILSGEMAVMGSPVARSSVRRAVSLQAFAREQGARILNIHVSDLSSDGCGFESDETFETATHVWLKIKGLGARRARIAWSAEGRHGCEFDIPLHPEELAELEQGHLNQLRDAIRAAGPGFGRAR